MHREASRQLVNMALIVMGLLVLARPDSARADEPPKPEGLILEFRILATEKHDREAIAKARAGAMKSPPEGYRWVDLGSSFKGGSPAFGDKTLTDPEAKWKADAFEGLTVECRGKNLAGNDLTRRIRIVGNTADTLRLGESPRLYFRSIASYRLKVDVFPNGGVAVRDEPLARGEVRHWVLVKLDKQNVTEKDLIYVSPTEVERGRLAIGFQLSRAGSRRFGELTRAHLPEEGGAFRYHLAIISEGRVVSAPVIQAEINDSGIIENVEPAAVDPLIKKLRAAIGKH